MSTTVATKTAPRQGEPGTHQPPSATSTSAAQPFSTPLTPSPAAEGITGKPKKPSVTVVSSVPEGQTLKGINFYKNKQDPVAMRDDEYPSWLWGILESKGSKEAEAEADLASMTKRQRRLAEKKKRKEEAKNPMRLEKKVPIYEQSVDLPAGDGSVQGAVQAGMAREDLTKAMRDRRRAKIKEANFLKAMG